MPPNLVARWAKTGREVSQQAQGALLGLVIGVGSVALGGGLFGGLLTALCVHKYWDRSSNRSAERVAAYRPGPAVGGGGVYAGVGGGGGGGGGTAGVPVAPVVLGPARRGGGVEGAAAAAAAAGAASRARAAAAAAGGEAGGGAVSSGGGSRSPTAVSVRRAAEPAPPLPMARLLSAAEGGEAPAWAAGGQDEPPRHRRAEGATSLVPRGLE